MQLYPKENSKSMKKKLFVSLVSIMLVFSLILVACQKPKDGDDGNGGGDTENPITVTSIALDLDTNNVKKTFQNRDTFDYAGLIVTATLSDDSTQVLKEVQNQFSVSTPNMTNNEAIPVDRTVTVTETISPAASRKTATYSITINPGDPTGPVDPDATIDSIFISNQADKILFQGGDEFTSQGLQITAEYSDGSLVPLPSTDYTIQTVDMTLGYPIKKVNIVLNSDSTKTASYDIHLIDPSVIYLFGITPDSKQNIKTTYTVGEHFDPTNLELELDYIYADINARDNSALAHQKVTVAYNPTTANDFEFTSDLFTTSGNPVVNFSYMGKTMDEYWTGIPVEVSNAKATIVTPPTQTEYNFGDTFDASGLVINVFGQEFAYETLSSNFTFDRTILNGRGEVTINGQFTLMEATYDIDPITVTIQDKVTQVDINTQPKTKYFTNETLDLSDLSIYVNYNNQLIPTVVDYVGNEQDFEFGNINDNNNGVSIDQIQEMMTTAGSYTFGIYYKGHFSSAIKGTFTITSIEKKVTSVIVTKQPTKTTYTVGDTFDASGLQVRVVYNAITDGISEVVEYNEQTKQDFSFFNNPQDWQEVSTLMSTEGTHKLGIYYGNHFSDGLLSTITITVEPVGGGAYKLYRNPNTSYYYGLSQEEVLEEIPNGVRLKGIKKDENSGNFNHAAAAYFAEKESNQIQEDGQSVYGVTNIRQVSFDISVDNLAVGDLFTVGITRVRSGDIMFSGDVVGVLISYEEDGYYATLVENFYHPPMTDNDNPEDSKWNTIPQKKSEPVKIDPSNTTISFSFGDDFKSTAISVGDIDLDLSNLHTRELLGLKYIVMPQMRTTGNFVELTNLMME